MRRFLVKQLTNNFFIELDFFRSFYSLNWFPIFNHSLDLRLKGSHKGLYWSMYLLGFKIFEINLYDKRHDENYIKHDPVLDY